MSLKINNIEALRDHVLDAINQLSDGTLELNQAGIIAKLSETVISGIKTQLEYSRLLNEQPNIKFLQTDIEPKWQPLGKMLLKHE